MASASSLNQNWNACTTVMLRMPPDRTMPSTMTTTNAQPTHTGRPATTRRVTPAPWNWGRR
jgi:hypothetical protein